MDPKLVKLLGELEAGLGNALRHNKRAGEDEEHTLLMLSDEYQTETVLMRL